MEHDDSSRGHGARAVSDRAEAKSQLSLVGPRVPESWDGGHGGQGSPAVLYSVLPYLRAFCIAILT